MTSRFKKTAGFTVSLGLHSALLLVGGVFLIKPVQYSVDQGSGGLEINLVAAPSESIPVLVPRVEEIMPETKPEIPLEKKPEEFKEKEHSNTKGTDKISVQSVGGALTEAKPDYLSNPAPLYPLEARRNKWQGVVILKISIDKKGIPISVDLFQSSGHKVLDDSAIKTVNKWKFSPAKIGEMVVETSVRVPVRFTLEHK